MVFIMTQYCIVIHTLNYYKHFFLLCLARVRGGDCGDEVASWLHRVLGKPYRLVCKSLEQEREAKKQPTEGADKVRLSLSNEAQYLLVTWSAVEHIHKLMGVAHNEEGAVVSLCAFVL